MNKLATPFRVGMLVIASGAFLFIFLSFVKKGGLSEDESIRVHAYFRDASGLATKSRVQIAGIPVGEVSGVVLEGTRARVTLKIRREVGLRVDATLTKRSESLLGDYLLDLMPGSERAPMMPDGGEITRVVDSQGMEKVFTSLEEITSDIKNVTSALSDVLGGSRGAGSMQKIMENLIRLSEAFDQTVRQSGSQLNDILGNFEAISGDVRQVTEGQQQTVQAIVQNLEVITRDVRDVLATVKQVVGGGEGDLKEGVASLKQTLARLDSTLANVEEITRKVKDGEGVAGKLISDERLGQRIDETVEGVADFADSLTGLKLQVGIQSEYLFAQAEAKSTFTFRVIPKPDKYYLLEVVDDPRGNVETVVVQNTPPGSGEPVAQVQRVTRDALKISAQFAKRYYFATLRFGLIESSGGLGADLHAWDDVFTLKLDAFDFSVEELRYPRLRASLRFQPNEHIFATFGIDDILNNQLREVSGTNRLIAGRDLFLGAGVQFTDEDLKALLTLVGTPSL